MLIEQIWSIGNFIRVLFYSRRGGRYLTRSRLSISFLSSEHNGAIKRGARNVKSWFINLWFIPLSIGNECIYPGKIARRRASWSTFSSSPPPILFSSPSCFPFSSPPTQQSHRLRAHISRRGRSVRLLISDKKVTYACLTHDIFEESSRKSRWKLKGSTDPPPCEKERRRINMKEVSDANFTSFSNGVDE